MECYFDNAATTRVFGCVRDEMVRVLDEDYANPSSRHKKGLAAERIVKGAAREVARSLRVKEKEIIFTSGGTESNNLALSGAAWANVRSGRHIISTRIEHASVYNPLACLEGQGFEVTYLDVDGKGHVNPDALWEALRGDTILVSVMCVNNEVGAIEPLEAIGELIRKKAPGALFHTDATQAYGKLPLRPKKLGVDLLSASGHKIHAPKGSGFLYADEHVKLKPILYGGGQQRDLRSGTENVPAIAGLGKAVETIFADQEGYCLRLSELKDRFIDAITPLDGVTINSEKGALGAPHIVSASFAGVRAEVLLHALEERGIYVSSGSACSSNHPGISSTLKAMHIRPELEDATLRFSFGAFNTAEEVDYAAEAVREEYTKLRKVLRRRSF